MAKKSSRYVYIGYKECSYTISQPDPSDDSSERRSTGIDYTVTSFKLSGDEKSYEYQLVNPEYIMYSYDTSIQAGDQVYVASTGSILL